ncbi:hypothetical protein HY622_03775 [Candidatus Uhrbacteria bacterium]|nr:hypothetical protein [Candidatus Uhrbacteria bacterium]
MQTKNILLVVVLLGLAALAVMLVVSQQQATPEEGGEGFVPGQEQVGPPPETQNTVPQQVEVLPPPAGSATGTESVLPPETGKSEPDQPISAVPNTPVVKTATVEMSDIGFTPASMTISAGTMVTFVNIGTRDMWPASAMHPTHAEYPTKGGCIGSTFDACKGLKPGEAWDFTFNEKGTWKYHDHLTPNMFAQITVQ